MTSEHDTEVARREGEASQEEARLFDELKRAMASRATYERRVAELKHALAEAERAGVSDRQLTERIRARAAPALDGEAALERAHAARRQALDTRVRAAQEVRDGLKRFLDQAHELAQQLAADEKQLQRLQAQAQARASTQDDGLGATLVAAGPPPGLRPKVQAPPVVPQPPSAPPQKRASQRVRMQAQVDFESEANFFNGFSSDISEGGLFIATVNLLPLGTQVDLGFSLPSGERVDCKGVVRWVREVDERQPDVMPGIGVQFVDLDTRAAQAVEAFVQQREPMFFVE
ncbi:MAG: TIGR02266 family protein [Myxococcaceae bacterium]|nr:TIGR02266 family protein [Myxococcaceae bacterium]